MSAQLMDPGLDPFVDADFLKATPGESGQAWRNYIGYWGKFSVDAKTLVITHEIEGSWFPNWIGRKQQRSFRFEREHLISEAQAAAGEATLVWRKLE